MHHGQRGLRRTRTESRATGCNLRRTRSRGRCHDNQQSLRLRIESSRSRSASDPDREQFHRRRGRHGVDDERSLPSSAGAQRISSRQLHHRRFHGARRPVGHLQRLPHGHHRRERRGEIRHHARRAGRVRCELASQGDRGHERMPLQVADRSGRAAREEERRRRR